MRKSLTITSMAGVISMMLAGAASAAEHPDFGGWRVDNGMITGTADGDICGSTSIYECSIIADGDGFVQRQVSLRDGSSNDSFIQTIVTDQTATGAPGADLGFYDVTFVKMSMNLGAGTNVTQNGIAGKQVILDTTSGPNQSFESVTEITTGWAQAEAVGGVTAPITISQSLSDMGDPATQGDDFISNFTYDASLNAEGVRDGFKLDLDQTVGLAANGGSQTDTQVFAFRQMEGTLNQTANPTGVALVGQQNMTWAAGDNVKAIWLGQEIDLSSVAGTGGSGGSMMGSSFGYVAFENVTSGGGAITEFGFGNKNSQSAWVWSPEFGSTPCITPDCGPAAPPPSPEPAPAL